MCFACKQTNELHNKEQSKLYKIEGLKCKNKILIKIFLFVNSTGQVILRKVQCCITYFNNFKINDKSLHQKKNSEQYSVYYTHKKFRNVISITIVFSFFVILLHMILLLLNYHDQLLIKFRNVSIFILCIYKIIRCLLLSFCVYVHKKL